MFMNMPEYEYVNATRVKGISKKTNNAYDICSVYLVGPSPNSFDNGIDIAFKASCDVNIYEALQEAKLERGTLISAVVSYANNQYRINFVDI